MVEFDPKALDSAYHAISDRTRRDVLSRLAAGPARITDLAGTRDMSFAAVSKHVRVIEQAGLIRRSIVGREHWLALEPAGLKVASHWLDGYRRFWEVRLDRLDEQLKRRER